MNRELLRWTAASALVAASLLQVSSSRAQGAAPPAPPAAAAPAGAPPAAPLQDPLSPPPPPPPPPAAPSASPATVPSPPAAPPPAYPPSGFGAGATFGGPTWPAGALLPPQPPAPPPSEERPHPKGVTDELVPFDQRGGIYVATSTFASGSSNLGGGSIALQGNFHLTRHFFLDATLPLGISTAVDVGNPTVEARGVIPIGRTASNFIFVGGGLGLPVFNTDSQRFEVAAQAAVVANGLWDLHLYTPWSVPMIGRFGSEHFLGRLALLRTDFDVVFEIPYGDNDEPEVNLQQAVELQLGQVIGGGLRVQTVILPTWGDADNELDYEGDVFQLAMEPFFSYEGEVMSGRIGLMMPIDAELGPPFAEGWGFRLGLGARFD